MKVLRSIWWLLGVFYTITAFGYGIAYIGWGFSIWERPEPGALLGSLSFIGAGLFSLKMDLEALSSASRKDEQ